MRRGAHRRAWRRKGAEPWAVTLQGDKAVFFCSRLIALGAAFLALAALRQRKGLALLMFADAGLQVFDLAWPLAHGVTNGFVLPLLIGVAEVAAGLQLLRATSADAARTTRGRDPASAGS